MAALLWLASRGCPLPRSQPLQPHPATRFYPKEGQLLRLKFLLPGWHLKLKGINNIVGTPTVQDTAGQTQVSRENSSV